MSAFDIVVVVLVGVAFVAVVGSIIYKKIKHKGGGCDCGCEGCSGCSHCNIGNIGNCDTSDNIGKGDKNKL